MNISDDGLALIRGFEGCKLKAYQDGGGIWTIGVGHTGGVKINDVITEADATNFLISDVREAVDAINYFLEVPLNQNQFDALCSFTFNLGVGSFQTSTLLKKLNNSDYAGAAQQFLRWVYDNGKMVPGLLNRRVSESKLFLTPVESP
jgi:lysozyme